MEEKENLDTNLIYELVIFYLDEENCSEDQVKRDLRDSHDRLIANPDADVDQHARIIVNAVKNFRKQGNDCCALDRCIEQAIDAELSEEHIHA